MEEELANRLDWPVFLLAASIPSAAAALCSGFRCRVGKSLGPKKIRSMDAEEECVLM